ncbi:ImmA/IrrE family metallo-endopeptidase [Clostridium sp.]
MVKRNFDAAHELGHIILHSKLSNIKELSNEEFKKLEVEANSFAS